MVQLIQAIHFPVDFIMGCGVMMGVAPRCHLFMTDELDPLRDCGRRPLMGMAGRVVCASR